MVLSEDRLSDLDRATPPLLEGVPTKEMPVYTKLRPTQKANRVLLRSQTKSIRATRGDPLR
jgi:hypothetical protein